MDVKTKETVTPDERKEETELLDKFLETDVFKAAMKFLVDKGFIPNDEYEFKDTLKRMWFSQFQRVEGEPSSSGFEAVFVAEKLDSFMVGPQNWIYFAKQEAQKNVDYRGYISDVKLADVSNITLTLFYNLSHVYLLHILRLSSIFTFSFHLYVFLYLCRREKLSRYARLSMYLTRSIRSRPFSSVSHPNWRWLFTQCASTCVRTTSVRFHWVERMSIWFLLDSTTSAKRFWLPALSRDEIGIRV